MNKPPPCTKQTRDTHQHRRALVKPVVIVHVQETRRVRRVVHAAVPRICVVERPVQPARLHEPDDIRRPIRQRRVRVPLIRKVRRASRILSNHTQVANQKENTMRRGSSAYFGMVRGVIEQLRHL